VIRDRLKASMSPTRVFEPILAAGIPGFRRKRASAVPEPQQAMRMRPPFAFTLLEMLVGMVVLGLLMMLLLSAVELSSRVFRSLNQKVDAFQDARFAFDLLTRNLSQATLNTFWRQDDPENPSRFMRESDLHFLVQPAGDRGLVPGSPGAGQAIFFQAPLGTTSQPESFGGLSSALNSLGYFVDFRAVPQPGITSSPAPFRYQLVQFKSPTEEMRAFSTRESGGMDWIDPTEHAKSIFPVAANVIALVLWPRRADGDPTTAPLTSDFRYDSRANATANPQPLTAHQLPPVVEVVMVAMDEESAERLTSGSRPPDAVRNALQGRFLSSAPDRIEADLVELEKALSAEGIRYRVFRTAVPLRESKWSES